MIRPAIWIIGVALLLRAGAGFAESPAAPAADDLEAAWSRFCDEVEHAGIESLRGAAPVRPEDRAAGIRYLAEQLAASIEREAVARDGFPLLRLGATTVGSWGLDAGDAKYLGAHIDPDGSYRLLGTLGTARLIAVQLVRQAPEFQAFGSISGDALERAADGSVELRIARERPAGWSGPFLALPPEADELLVREYFADWSTEEVSALRLERIDAASPPSPMQPAEVGPFLERVARQFASRPGMWFAQIAQTRAHLRNRLAPPRTTSQGLGDNAYGSGWFDLQDGELLLIELEPPDALLWSFQLGNLYWESIDYVRRTGSLNGEQLRPSSDGKVRIVIAAEDPGVPNWLDTGGYREGAILYRYQQTKSAPVPVARLLERSTLRSELPPDTPTVSAEERAVELAARRAHAARRWGP